MKLRYEGFKRRVNRRRDRKQETGNRGQGRPKKRWIDCVKEDLNEKELTVDMAKDRIGWRSRIRAADPGTVWD